MLKVVSGARNVGQATLCRKLGQKHWNCIEKGFYL